MRKGADLPWDQYMMSAHDLIIGDPIAAGGEAVINEATQVRDPDGPKVVVKCPHDTEDPIAAFEQVLQEAWALMYIAKHSEGHPSRHNIVTLHGLCTSLPNVPHTGALDRF